METKKQKLLKKQQIVGGYDKSKYISKRFKLNLLTSGLLYRYVAYKLIVSKKKPSDSLFRYFISYFLWNGE